MSGRVRLSRFDNAWYSPGRALWVRVLWLGVSRVFFTTSLPWPSAVKRRICGTMPAVETVIARASMAAPEG